MPEWTGLLELDAERRQDKTVTKNLYFQGAFKIMRPVYHDRSGHPSYYVLNPGGGYLDGDTYRMKISLGERAELTLTTQSATKIYKTPKTHAYQEAEFYLEEGSYLEYLPDPLIAYKDARYLQRNTVHMAKGATFLYSDILTPGWSPDREDFSYDSLRLINEFYMEGELVSYDHIKLNPGEQHMNGIGFMEGYTHLGSFIVISDKVEAKLIDQIYDMMEQETEDFKVGISELAVSGFTIRILANSTQVIERIITKSHHIISQEWFQTKPSSLRKY
ncbi:urease accessory protein UreD [Lentibacillus kapialis]|uniref:Urease accessory protein UreD n=1 Tax=Lentibacillus kapialis TaxID=340214 RepID=A0A917USL2_9BACI|nr:urease accessory protein UreD [Lentibacillus kapialis]GGJ82092.1 urease accessory protein UreD [Lentibacillus kapialis]